MATTKKAAGKAAPKRFRVKLEEHEGMETLSFVAPFDVQKAFGTRGRYAPFFWAGILLTLGAVFAPLIGVAAAPLALTGLALHEHAYVQAGQSVPLA